jgi:hypothetical protein
MKPLFAFLLLGSLSTASAQSQLIVPPDQRPEVRPIEPGTPMMRVVYDVAEARIRSIEPAEPDRIALGGPCYDNSGGYLAASVVTNAGEELVDWGVKQCRESGLIRSFTIAFQNTGTDIGGPGGAMSIALYQGTRGWGDLGTEVFRRTVTGLPRGWGQLVIDFGLDPLPLGDGPIGWGVLQVDGDTGPILVTAPSLLLGTVDALDLYVPGPATPDSYVGTFNYGGCSAGGPWLCASFFIQIDEIPKTQVAAAFVVNGTGVNPVLLDEILPARLGQTWVGRIDITGEPFGTTTLLVPSSATIAPVLHPLGELLLDPARVLAAPVPGLGGYAFPIPADAALAGMRLFVQGVVLPVGGVAPAYLTNALRIRLGY